MGDISVSGKPLEDAFVFYKYPEIEHIGDESLAGIFDDEVYVQEKIDGGNFRFTLKEGKLFFGSRNQIIEENTKAFIAISAVQEAFENNPDSFGGSWVFYGESCQRHTMKYDNIPPFVGFDIRHKQTGLFLDAERAKAKFKKMGLPFIPILLKKHGGDIKIEELQEQIKQPSLYGSLQKEGVVIKNYKRLGVMNNVLWGKIVSEDFKEQNKLVFSHHHSSDAIEKMITKEFCTPARIRKQILRAREELRLQINMTLMPWLYAAVAQDIIKEEYLTIAKKYAALKFKPFNSLVAKLCASELKKFMLERSYPVEVSNHV